MKGPAGGPPVVLRDTAETDMPAVTEIYARHVETGLGTFEETPPEAAEMTRRWRAIVEAGYPHIVAATPEAGLVGYACASAFRPRSAYRFTAEDSVYVRPGWERRGLGRALLSQIIQRASAAGIRQLIAMIGDSANAGSIELHASLGFETVGVLVGVGRKHGQWADVVQMQRALGAGDTEPPARA